MTDAENQGLTAREAVLAYCTNWTRAGYLYAWPSEREFDPHVPKDERIAAQRTVSNELKAMICLAFDGDENGKSSPSDQVASRKVKKIGSGRLPRYKGKASKAPVISGLLVGEISLLKVAARGAWTLEERGDALVNRDAGKVVERYIITRKNGDTCRLTVTLQVTKEVVREGSREKIVKRAVYVDDTVDPWTPTNDLDLVNLARARDFLRKNEEIDEFVGPPGVPLRVEGRASVNQPLVRLTFEDIRNIEFDIEDNSASGDGREFHGLRFSTTSPSRAFSEGAPDGGAAPSNANEHESPPKGLTSAARSKGGRRLGRPSSKREIRQAFKRLVGDGKADLTSLTANYRPIRELIRQDRGLKPSAVLKGCGNETIRKIIGPMIDALKRIARSQKISQIL